MSEWISVKDRLPEKRKDVWIAFRMKIFGDDIVLVAIGCYSDKKWKVFMDGIGVIGGNRVICWQPIEKPDPPEVNDETK